MNRTIKILLAASSAFLCLMYALQNLANLEAARAFVSYVVSMEEHTVYPGHLGPAISSPSLAGLILAVIITLELAAGLLAARGAVTMFLARQGSIRQFDAAKHYALAGTGLAVFLWFGVFGAIGGAYFQMWQTEAGANSLQGAFQYAVLNAIAWMMIRTED